MEDVAWGRIGGCGILVLAIIVGIAFLQVGADKVAINNSRDEAMRKIILLHLPSEDEARLKEAMRLANSEDTINDTLEKAKTRSSEIEKAKQH